MNALLLAISLIGLGHSQPATEVVRNSLRHTASELKSIQITYKSRPEGANGQYAIRRLYMKSPDSVYHIAAHGSRSLEWQDDPLQVHSLISGNDYMTFNPLNRTYSARAIRSTDPLPGSLYDEFFFVSTGWWPLDSRESPTFGQVPYILLDIANSSNYSLIPPIEERVQGRVCYVFGWEERDKMWLDKERGCTLLAREMYDSSAGAKIRRIELSRHWNCAPGIWMPREIRTIIFDANADLGARNEAIRDVVIDVIDVEVNDVSNDVFKYELPPGALDITSVARQTKPGGVDHLEKTAVWIRQHAAQAEESHYSHFNLRYLSGLPALILLVFLEFRRRGQRREARISTGKAAPND